MRETLQAMPKAACERIEFVVHGRAVAKGNITRNRAGRAYDSTKGLLPWTGAVRYSCRQAAHAAQWSLSRQPVSVHLEFEMYRPLRLRRSAPAVKPDLDKLCRAVLDALTGVAYVDDAQVCHLEAAKCYAALGERACCKVMVAKLHFAEKGT